MIRTTQYAIDRLTNKIQACDAIVRGVFRASYLYSKSTYYIVEDLTDGRQYHVPTWLVSWEV